VKTRKLLSAAILAALVCGLPLASRAGTLSTDILSMFPKETGEMAYADLKTARQYPWFAQLKEQMLPPKFRQFEQFLVSVGVDPNSQVQELAWGLVPSTMSGTGGAAVPSADEVVGVALGQYDPSSAEAMYTAKKLPIVKVRTLSLFAFGSGSGPNDLFFTFLDSNTAAFGSRKQLEQLIGVRYGETQGLFANADFSALVNQANGSGVVWAVLDPAYARLAMQQLVPETAQFPAAAQLSAKLKALTIGVQTGSGVQAKFEAVCGSTDDANTFAALLQAGIMYRRYQVGSTNPDLAQMLDQTQVAPAGDRLDLSLSLTDDQMTALIRKNTFSLKM